jgi:hypothetical protein
MKQETIKENCCTPIGQIKRYVDCKGCDRKPKQETLEETAERISPIQQVINFITENFQKEGEPRQLTLDLLKKWCEVKLLNEESKWQQERSYSEDDLKECYEFAIENVQLGRNGYEWVTFEEWFEQFKKK